MKKAATLAAAILCLSIVTPVFGANVPRYRMRTPLQKVAGDEGAPAPAAHRFGEARRFGAAAITPGTQVGTTYYDYQHNGSTGHQVDKTGNNVQATWTKGTTAGLTIRTVNWNRVAVAGGPANFTLDDGSTVRRLALGSPLLANGQEFSAVRPGYTNFRNRPGGKGVCQYHDFPESGGIQYWEVQLDLTSGNGIFAGTPSVSPNPPGSEYQATAVVWPKQAISQCGGDMVHHAIGTWSGASNEVWYWRGIINDGAGSIAWPGLQPELLDPLNPNDAFITNVIEARGSEVQIFMFKPINNTNADLVRYVSSDCGVTWGAMQNLTNYSAAGPEGGNVDVAIAYDDAGLIHAIFDTAPASGETTPTNLYHWSLATGIRLITSAGWTNTCGGGTITNIAPNNGAGSNNLAIAEVSLSIKPPAVHGIADELLYAVWTQFGPTDTDCATVDDQGTLGGHVNGELYCSVSSNGGLTWDRPQNITGTVTPDCDPGDCYSESWVTAAAQADSGVYLSYVDDRHAGPIVFAGGAWAESPYTVYAPEARHPVLAPVIAVTPTNYIELRAHPGGGSESVDLNVISVGNANLSYTVTVMADNGGASHITLNGLPSVSSTILAGGAPHIIDVEFDALGLGDPAEYMWRLEVTSNDPENDPGQGGDPIDVNLQVFSASVWNECTDDTLSTGSHRMQVSSCLEMGDVGGTGRGFMSYADSSEWMYSGSPVITRVLSGDTVAHHNAFMSLADRTRALNKSFRAQSPFHVKRDSAVAVGDSTYTADVATGTASTTDTTIELDYAMVFPKSPGMNRGAYFRFSMSSLTGGTQSGVSFGAVADIDVDPNAAQNAGAGSEANGWIGQVGGTSDTAGNFTPNTKYMALFHLPQGASCSKNGAQAAQVLANPNYVHPEGGYNTDSLYKLFTTFGAAASWGTGIHIDTGQNFDDLSIMLVSGYNQTVSHVTPTVWGYGLALSTVSTTDLMLTIAALRAASSANCQGGDCLITLPGDQNNSNTVTSADIITLVGYVFKGGAAPVPCVAAGDVNCSGTVTSADIITLVGYVFKGGAPPCDICAGSPMAASCN